MQGAKALENCAVLRFLTRITRICTNYLDLFSLIGLEPPNTRFSLTRMHGFILLLSKKSVKICVICVFLVFNLTLLSLVFLLLAKTQRRKALYLNAENKIIALSSKKSVTICVLLSLVLRLSSIIFRLTSSLNL